MTGNPRVQNEGIPLPERLPVIHEIIGGDTPIRFTNISIGERAVDEPTEFDIFALYYPLHKHQYELISIAGEQLSKVQPIREKLRNAELNQESLGLQEVALDKIKTKIPELKDSQDVHYILDLLGLPYVMIAFGHRVRDGGDTTLLFYPAIISPVEPLEEFKALIEEVIAEENI